MAIEVTVNKIDRTVEVTVNKIERTIEVNVNSGNGGIIINGSYQSIADAIAGGVEIGEHFYISGAANEWALPEGLIIKRLS